MSKVLITGGAGYVGSHTYLSLIDAGYEPIIVDNFSNSKEKVLQSLSKITKEKVNFKEGDICDYHFLNSVIKKNSISSVMHFAALKSVEDSINNPLLYYKNNVEGLINLLKTMNDNGCNKLIFSSSACVYGISSDVPVKENSNKDFVNPYGHTKIICEDIIKNISLNSELNFINLRYFNPIGCHESEEIGEDPKGKISNLMPCVADTAIGNQPFVKIFGNNYDTRDGTGVRDFIHIMDIAEGHLAALDIIKKEKVNCAINLGTGKGISVLEVINAYQKVSEKKIRYEFFPERKGDIGEIYADVTLAKKKLKWQARRDIIDMCQSSWAWKKRNPYGY